MTPRLHRARFILFGRRVPAAVLVALAIFGGCGTPYYPYEQDVYANNPRLRLPQKQIGPDTVYVKALGLRRARETGDLRLDVLLAGPRAFDVACQWIYAPRAGAVANAVVSLRRTSPDAQPISLRFAGDSITAEPLADNGNELGHAITRSDERIMLTLTLDCSPAWTPGLYEVQLLVPSATLAAPWHVGTVEIVIEEAPMRVQINESGRIKPETMYVWP